MCRVRVGSFVVVLPFIIKGEFPGGEDGPKPTDPLNEPAGWEVDSVLATVIGDAGGDQMGLKSGTIESEVRVQRGSNPMEGDGKTIVRPGDMCTMNRGNTFGPVSLRGGPAPSPDGMAPRSTPQDEADTILAQVAAGTANGLAPMVSGHLQVTPGQPKQHTWDSHARRSTGAAGRLAGKKQNTTKMPETTTPNSPGSAKAILQMQ
jgi:hypothetical protein